MRVRTDLAAGPRLLDPRARVRRRRARYARTALLIATVAAAVVVSVEIKTFGFFWAVAVPLAVTGAVSLYFRSWTVVVFTAGVYLYLILFWGVGFVGQFLDRTLAEGIAAATGWSRGILRFASYIAAWLLFVAACEVVIDRFVEQPRRRR